MQNIKFKSGSPAPAPLHAPDEMEIMRTWLPHTGKPLVSICCATFNHAAFLKDALNGFLAQITSFPFEIIIRDDASTDGTSKIVMDYAARYPNIIRAIIETENQHSKGIRANPALVPYAMGQYIALCEGDDYWISADKLEKQVNLLIANPEATMCVAKTVVCNETSSGLFCDKVLNTNEYCLQFFNEITRTYFHTSTYLIRSEMYRNVLDRYANKIEYGDTALRYMLVDIGPFALLNEVVSVYRVTGHGIWTSLDKPRKLALEIKMAEGFYKHFNSQYRSFFGEMLLRSYLLLMLRHGTWKFNNRLALGNFKQLIYFAAKHGKRLIRFFMRS